VGEGGWRRVNDSDEVGFILFTFFMAIVYSLWRLIKKILGRGIVDEEEKKKGKKGSPKRFVKKEFFVTCQTRRRKLNLTRRDNIVSTSLGKKLKRQRRGIFGK